MIFATIFAIVVAVGALMCERGDIALLCVFVYAVVLSARFLA